MSSLYPKLVLACLRDKMSELRDRIKQLRMRLGLRQQDMASALSVPITTISKYELGLVKPSSDLLTKIGIVYKVNLNWLLTGSGDVFLVEDIIAATGTENRPFLRLVKSKSKEIRIEQFSMIPEKELKDIGKCEPTDCDEYMINLAQKLNKPLTVEYFESNQQLGVKKFNPDGSIDKIPVLSSQIIDKDRQLRDKIEAAMTEPNKREFIEIAVDALSDSGSIEKLKIMIKGIELANKSK